MDLLFAAIAYYILSRLLIFYHGKDSKLASAVGVDKKGIISIILYAIAIVLAFYHSLLAYLLYVVVAVMWLVPDKRIEKILSED